METSYEQHPEINGWLRQVINDYQDNHTSQEIHDAYELEAADSDLLWEDYVMSKALLEAAENRPVLRVSIWDLPLPEATQEALNKLYVDTVADLMQYSEEEWEYYQQFIDFDKQGIQNFLLSNGLQMSATGLDTYKISYLKVVRHCKGGYAIELSDLYDYPELLSVFDLGRPSLSEEWFDEYYQSYGYTSLEEQLLNELKDIRLTGESEDKLHQSYHDYFYALRQIWWAYRDYCRKHQLEMDFVVPYIPETPADLESFPNAQLISLKKDTLRALVSLYRRMGSFRGSSIASFLRADHQEKLEIAQQETDQVMQLLMILHTELLIDFESLLIDLRVKKRQCSQTDDDGMPGIFNPWLSLLIKKYRLMHTEAQMRELYKKDIEENPQRVWSRWMGLEAVLYAAEENPVLLYAVKNLDLSEYIKNTLINQDILFVAEMMQQTTKDYAKMFDEELGVVDTINAYMKPYGLTIWESEVDTLKVLLPKKYLREEELPAPRPEENNPDDLLPY